MLRVIKHRLTGHDDQNHRDQDEDGFSLTEVMVAVFIIGLLSVVALGPALSALQKGNATAVKKDIATFENVLTQYYMEMGEYPTTQQGLEALYEVPPGTEKAERYRTGGYLDKRSLLTDPWGNLYQYQYPGDRAKFDIYSLGADGRPGGEAENADIGNWD